MSNNYVGGMTAWGSVAALQQAAEAENARPDAAVLTDGQDGNAVRLEGETGEAYGSQVGTEVPNLSVTRVSSPAKTRGLPDSLPTNPLTGARERR